MKIILWLLLFTAAANACDHTVSEINIGDGCTLYMDLVTCQRPDGKGYSFSDMKITNPDECRDKGLVRYLNCTQVGQQPQPKECL